MVLPDCVLLPRETLPLHIFEPRYRMMLQDVLEGSRSFCVARIRPGSLTEEAEEIACAGYVTLAKKQDDGTSNLQIEGAARVRLKPAVEEQPYPFFDISPIESDSVSRESCAEELSLLDSLLRKNLESGIEAAMAVASESGMNARDLAKTRRELENGVAAWIDSIAQETDPGLAADRTAARILGNADHRQAVLEERNPAQRMKLLIHLLGGHGEA